MWVPSLRVTDRFKVFSQPQVLLLAALALEAACVYNNVAPFNHHTVSLAATVDR